ncbi:hypothetical protein BU16DRAFT_287634 [Lophium mytilinum]|uniref:Rhodopsin domain-containing protein n=1 Tax=Lophium mytilinum TaxID=390894 RepID=A0A6A6R0J3_9PEZI|nr:hypothetical protein BU16DRAFT_287634 [Lophium mytilinum]
MADPKLGDFGPAPPGMNLADNQNGVTYGAVITLMIIGTVSVVLRFMARMKPGQVQLAMDDWLIVGALIFAWGTGICSLLSINYGGGKHLWALKTSEFTQVWKLLFGYVMIYATAVTLTKVSILVFYRRIFGITYSFYVCMFLAIGYWITIIVVDNVGCQPLSFFWTQYTDPTAIGTCINFPKFFFGNGIAAMLIDVIILGVPVPIVWGLQMARSQKVAVVSILLLGSFVCVASIVRIVMLQRNTSSSDPTWTISPVFVWSCVEPFIGILCACLPTFAPFFRRWWGVIRTRGTSEGKYSKSGGIDSKGFDTPADGGSKQLSSAGGAAGFRLSRSKGRSKGPRAEWMELESGMRDDEIALTNKITGGKGATGSVESMPGIMVREDVEWTSSKKSAAS